MGMKTHDSSLLVPLTNHTILIKPLILSLDYLTCKIGVDVCFYRIVIRSE